MIVLYISCVLHIPRTTKRVTFFYSSRSSLQHHYYLLTNAISVFIPACFCSVLIEKDDKRSQHAITEKVVKRQPGDGHCVIYSVQESLRHSAVSAVPSTAGLLEMMKFEILNNKDHYEEFCMNADVSRDLERYVREKVHNKDRLDLAVNALANCLGVELRIYELSEDKQRYQLYTVPIPPARRKDPPRVVLDILKTGEHYDALIDSPTLDQGRNEQFNPISHGGCSPPPNQTFLHCAETIQDMMAKSL